jgi:CheY-like chemotaxis protein
MSQPYIVIVEENFMIADTLRAALAECDYRVIVVGSAHAALILAQRETPDLAIVDLSRRGGLPGVEAAQRIGALGAAVIACTAFDGRPADEWLDMLHPVGVLRKPISMPDMRDAVAGALAGRETPPANRVSP